MTRNKIAIVAIMVIISILLYSCIEATPTCNAEAVFWPTEVAVPPEWGTPCPDAWLELPTVLSMSMQSYPYTVWGRVTVGETTPLKGAEIRVNRIVGGAQTGAGMAISDADGIYRIGISEGADAYRIWIEYPSDYTPWGVTAPVVPWGLTLIHWPNPPENCGPIHWKAAYRYTPTPTVTAIPSRTPTRTPRPTRTMTPTPTATASITPTATQTRTPTVTPTAPPLVIPSPPPRPPMPDTMLGVAQEHLRVMWRLERVIYMLAVTLLGAIAKVIKMGK